MVAFLSMPEAHLDGGSSPLSRRKPLRMLGYGAIGSSVPLLGCIYASRIETEWVQVQRVQIPLRMAGAYLEGFKIALLSDFHLYPTTRIELIERAVEMANQLKPDLVALGGDYVQGSVDAIFDLAPALARLDATYGVFCILGNHDHWKGDEVVEQGLRESGLHLLRNEGLTLSVGRKTVYLAGLDDGWMGRQDLERGLEKQPPGVPTILLMHEPDFVDSFVGRGRIDLQLSGHSHGGQVRFPFIGSPFLPPYGRKYDKGLYRVANTWLYTTVGLGVTAPVRFNCPPEVTEITLV